MTAVKRPFRSLAILGAVGAAVWAMRDRIMSIIAPTEPEPPSFRVVTPPSGATPDELLRVDGIGPVFAARLAAAGISTLSGLVEAGAERVAAVVDLPASRVQGWIDQASSLVS